MTLCKLAKIYCGSKDKESKPYEGVLERVKRDWINEATAAAGGGANHNNHNNNNNNHNNNNNRRG